MSSFPLKAENFAWHQAVDWAIKTIPRAVLQTLAHLCFMLFLTPTPPWLRDPSFSLLPDPIHITLLYLPTSSQVTMVLGPLLIKNADSRAPEVDWVTQGICAANGLFKWFSGAPKFENHCSGLSYHHGTGSAWPRCSITRR